MLLYPHHFMSTLTKPLNHGWRRVAGMCLLCAAWFAAVLHLPAATPTPLPVDTLGTAEVVASAWLRGMRSAAPLQHLDSAAVLQRGITDVGDALKRFAGVNLRDYGGAGGLKTVSVRGLGATHTAVSYDGLCLTDTRQGMVDLQRFSLDRLTGISLSTLDAAPLLCPVRHLAAAVVELSTQRHHYAAGLHGTAALRQGSFGTWNPSLLLATAVGHQGGVSLAGDYFYATNDYPFTIANGVASERARRQNSRMQAFNAEADARFALPHGTWSGKVFVSHDHRRLPGQVTLYNPTNNERLTDNNAFGQLMWRHHRGPWQWYAAAKGGAVQSHYTDVSAQYPGGSLSQCYRQREAYVTAGAALQAAPWLALAYATDYDLATLRSNLPTDSLARRHLWLQSLSLRLSHRRLTVTARGVLHLSTDRRNGSHEAEHTVRMLPSLTALLRLVERPWSLTLRAGCKQTLRVPTFTERYYYHLGTANLKPERAGQWSAGLTLQASPSHCWRLLALTADGYLNHVRQRIVSVPYNLFVWRTVNLGRSRTAGIDATLQSTWSLARRHELLLAANYSLQRSTDRTLPGSTTYNRQLPYTPLHSGAASLAWQNPWLSIALHATAASERWSTLEHTATTRLKGYIEWGAAAWRDLQLRRGKLQLRADLINAGNCRYEVVRRYPMPGRCYKVALSYTW
ncbi:MAG: TonB-dependent receptor plug domain-containing protein [Bacteroidales bacterium]|nr:TonB-dependent receptor plug domain-containing protein [Bacteroidales bacterium]